MYEMCYRKHVRQFRHEAGGKREDFSCGKYAGDEAQREDIQVGGRCFAG
jgi:protein OS-9